MKHKKPTQRKPISKKLRFDVFKRDGFQCVYCGKTPPEVTLEIDHIEPVSKGGTNDINNLVSACFDCNRGKRDVRLTKKPNKIPENIAILKEQEEQLKEYQKLIRKQTRRINNDIKIINNAYIEAYPEWELSEAFKVGSIKRFLEKLSREEIVEALNIAISKCGNGRNRMLSYFCGICWRKIKMKTDPSYRSNYDIKSYWRKQPKVKVDMPNKYLNYWRKIHSSDDIIKAIDSSLGDSKALRSLLGELQGAK